MILKDRVVVEADSCTRRGGFRVQVVHLTFDGHRDPSLGRKRGHGQDR